MDERLIESVERLHLDFVMCCNFESESVIRTLTSSSVELGNSLIINWHPVSSGRNPVVLMKHPNVTLEMK